MLIEVWRTKEEYGEKILMPSSYRGEFQKTYVVIGDLSGVRLACCISFRFRYPSWSSIATIVCSISFCSQYLQPFSYMNFLNYSLFFGLFQGPNLRVRHVTRSWSRFYSFYLPSPLFIIIRKDANAGACA